ncbi:MAG: large subunit ribosomal protein L30 [Sphingobacteriales bacterium]|jgi:large subunit ribosomal protein L30
MGKIRITKVKSTIDREKSQKLTMIALGLKKMNQSVEVEATPAILGMVTKINHLITVEKVK